MKWRRANGNETKLTKLGVYKLIWEEPVYYYYYLMASQQFTLQSLKLKWIVLLSWTSYLTGINPNQWGCVHRIFKIFSGSIQFKFVFAGLQSNKIPSFGEIIVWCKSVIPKLGDLKISKRTRQWHFMPTFINFSRFISPRSSITVTPWWMFWMKYNQSMIVHCPLTANRNSTFKSKWFYQFIISS